MLRSVVAAILLAGGGAQALAAEDFIQGVYLQSEELCAQAKKDDIQAVAEAGNVMLTDKGLDSIEYNCEFVQILKSANSPSWAVTAICSEPGYLFPDVLSVTQMSPTQIEIVSVRPSEEEGGVGGNSGSYVLCDGVSMP